jgi:Tol biopolymer transport system component
VAPNGASFFVAGGDQSTNVGAITEYDVASGAARELYRAAPGLVLRNLAISPDGQLLAFSVANPEVRRYIIYVLPAAGGEIREVVRFPEAIGREGLAWTPDGRSLLFVRATGLDRAELFRVSSQGGAPESTGLVERGLSFLTVHPDGPHIAYTVGQYFRTDIRALENFLPASGSVP